MDDKRFYSIDEFVERLKQAGVVFSPRTVRHWIKTGKILAFRPGQRQWYIPAGEADKILKGPVEGRPPQEEDRLTLRLAVA